MLFLITIRHWTVFICSSSYFYFVFCFYCTLLQFNEVLHNKSYCYLWLMSVKGFMTAQDRYKRSKYYCIKKGAIELRNPLAWPSVLIPVPTTGFGWIWSPTKWAKPTTKQTKYQNIRVSIFFLCLCGFFRDSIQKHASEANCSLLVFCRCVCVCAWVQVFLHEYWYNNNNNILIPIYISLY